jgi:hypothetical protein
MANFTTHIAAGTLAAGGLATLTLAANVVGPENLVAVTLAGVLGSVLPDIDLKDSRPSRAMFAGLAMFFSFAVLFSFATKYSIAELWVIWLGTLLFVRYGIGTLFHRFAVHRGVWHSVLAGVFCAIATAIVFARVLGKPDGVAWLAGGFLLIGYLVHLALDEIYSVDVMDTRLKSSFGTALKLVDSRHPRATIAMLTATIFGIWLSPSTSMFLEGISSKSMWTGLQQRLLPEDKWFGLVGGHRHAVVEGTSPITTGTLPATATPSEPSGVAAPAGTQPAAAQSQPATSAPATEAPAAAPNHAGSE